MDNTEILFIINPKAGIGNKKHFSSKITQYFTNKPTVKYVYTESESHLKKLAKEAVNSKIPFIISVGGDGTLNKISDIINGTESSLGIIPRGSGNGLSHFLKIPFALSKNIKQIKRAKIRKIDTASINNNHFISVAGIGFDAHVAHLFNQSKRRGFMKYVLIVIKEYFKYKEHEYTIIADGKKYKKKAFLISFANSNQFGFHTVISPHAKIDDGLIDICVFRRPFPIVAVFVWPLIFIKRLHKTKLLTIIQAKEICIQNRKDDLIHVDGECITDKTESIQISIKKQSLQIINYSKN
jgi:YegS/Rv2252/BmrU family lipid kinase